jgi:hypothetical protein
VHVREMLGEECDDVRSARIVGLGPQCHGP